jgi:hypothetical protein
MIEFRCPDCGKGLRVADEYGGKKGTCVACGVAVDIPMPVAARGVRIEEGGLGTPIGKQTGKQPEGAQDAASWAAGLLTVAEGSCRLWRAGEMPPGGNPEHTVTKVGLSGLKVVLNKETKGRTLTHLHRAPWAQGDLVEVDLKLGAFATPIRLYAQVARVESAGLGKGTELDLRITQADGEAMVRLQLLHERLDLRQRRTKDTFD